MQRHVPCLVDFSCAPFSASLLLLWQQTMTINIFKKTKTTIDGNGQRVRLSRYLHVCLPICVSDCLPISQSFINSFS